jgi:hypothetical protein
LEIHDVVEPVDFSKVIVDTTVRSKAVAFPTDAKPFKDYPSGQKRRVTEAIERDPRRHAARGLAGGLIWPS